MALVYDAEIVKAIPPKNASEREFDIEYCAGWNDHANMGISVMGVYDTKTGRSHVFCEDNKEAFIAMCDEEGDYLVSFNGLSFDNKLIEACWGYKMPEHKCYDLLVEIWAACGLGPRFQYPSHAGFKLDYMLRENGIPMKTGDGARAPIDWQKGRVGTVIDYCLNDCWTEAKLLEKALTQELLTPPESSYGGKPIRLRRPWEGTQPGKQLVGAMEDIPFD